MNAIEKFEQIASQERFKGWPLIGGYKFGEPIPGFGQVLNYQLLTSQGVECCSSLLRQSGWAVVFGITAGQEVVTSVQWKPGLNAVSWELPPGDIGKLSAATTQPVIMEMAQTAYRAETGYGDGAWRYLGSSLVETGKYRGLAPESHGSAVHYFLATDLEPIPVPGRPETIGIKEILLVPLAEFAPVLASGRFQEISSQVCAYRALDKLAAAPKDKLMPSLVSLACLTHSDRYRDIYECNLPDSSLQILEIKSETAPLGNHYHRRKTERFLLAAGSGRVVLQELDRAGQPIGEQRMMSVEVGAVIAVHPYTAHAFSLRQGSSLVCFSSEPFTEDDNDIVPYLLER